MRSREFLKEDDIGKLKKSVANKIEALPETPPVEKTLGEIENILTYVHAGGRMASIKGELVQIKDTAVEKAHKLLVKYIASIEMTPAQREELFTLWKNDKLVKRDVLLSGKNVPLSQIFNGYSTNPAIRELVDDLSGIAFLGQGKGEFLLNVLSKGVSKMGKGDLRVDNKAIEVKTLDKGSGRFFDQEVKPASVYNSNRDSFMVNYGKKYRPHAPKSGLRLLDLVEISKEVDDKAEYKKSINAIFESLFPGQDVSTIVKEVMAGNIGPALQAYARTNVMYYFDVKKKAEALDGVLYIDLSKDPMTMMFFKDFSDLEKEGLRLHANTVYPVTNDIRNAYPQIMVVPTKGVAAVSAATADQSVKSAKTLKTKSKTKEPSKQPKPAVASPKPEELKIRARKK